MDELLKRRLDRAMEGLPDDKVRPLLDYIDFLKSKYADRSSQPSVVERIADSVEDTLRVGKAPIAAIKGTRGVLDTADRVMRGLADAGRSVVDEIQGQFRDVASGGPADPPETPDADEEQKPAAEGDLPAT